jgi:hypothetical protein
MTTMGKKSFSAPRTVTVRKDMKVAGVKNSGGGGVRQSGNTSPKTAKTNP